MLKTIRENQKQYAKAEASRTRIPGFWARVPGFPFRIRIPSVSRSVLPGPATLPYYILRCSGHEQRKIKYESVC